MEAVMEIMKKDRKGRNKIRDVPIATIKMNKPVYAVPLQTTMALNFLVHKPTHNERSSISPLERQQSLGYEGDTDNHTQRRTSTDYENMNSDKINKRNSSMNETLPNQNSHHNHHQISKNNVNKVLSTKSLKEEAEAEEAGKEGDSDGELDVDKLAERGKKHKSSFNHMTWRLPSPKHFQVLPSSTIVYKDAQIVVMIKLTSTSDVSLKSSKVHVVMLDVAENCAKRLKQMMHMSLPKLSPRHMDSLPLSDHRPAKTHLEALSEELGDEILFSDVAYRYRAEDIFIGTYVCNKVKSTKHSSIGKIGVVAILSRKSKYATIEAFSEQLCRHIAATKPSSVGHVSDADIRKINKRGTMKIVHLQKDQLMLQNFSFDCTIIVAEAARRSFVKIEDFMLFH